MNNLQSVIAHKGNSYKCKPRSVKWSIVTTNSHEDKRRWTCGCMGTLRPMPSFIQQLQSQNSSLKQFWELWGTTRTATELPWGFSHSCNHTSGNGWNLTDWSFISAIEGWEFKALISIGQIISKWTRQLKCLQTRWEVNTDTLVNRIAT